MKPVTLVSCKQIYLHGETCIPPNTLTHPQPHTPSPTSSHSHTHFSLHTHTHTHTPHPQPLTLTFTPSQNLKPISPSHHTLSHTNIHPFSPTSPTAFPSHTHFTSLRYSHTTTSTSSQYHPSYPITLTPTCAQHILTSTPNHPWSFLVHSPTTIAPSPPDRYTPTSTLCHPSYSVHTFKPTPTSLPPTHTHSFPLTSAHCQPSYFLLYADTDTHTHFSLSHTLPL